MTTASLAVHVKVSALLRQFLRVRSIQSIPISAQSVVLVHLFVLLRQSACPNYVWYVIKAKNKGSQTGAFIYLEESEEVNHCYLLRISHIASFANLTATLVNGTVRANFSYLATTLINIAIRAYFTYLATTLINGAA